MSRARHQESLNAVQLFPFVAVLLCTMGSLLVLLVAVSRTSRVQAEQRVAEARARAVEAPPVDDQMRVRLEQARQHLAMLRKQEALAKEHLQNDQLQLGHLEDHMRRLQTELESLRTAAAEMNSLEKTHFDDREQGQRELERLRELIDDRTQAIDELRKEKSSRRTYAIIPFKTPGGTQRPPVYFECRHDGIYLLPEEIRFTVTDFRGPHGSGTPVAAAFRAAREHLISQAKVANPTEETEPYALVVVRPDGHLASKHLMKALDEAGIAFGYEIVESDAEITYPLADPKLLAVEMQAVETARGRMEMLAAAAPRAYENQAEEDAYLEAEGEDDEFDSNDDVTSYESEDDDSTGERRGTQLAIDSFPGTGVRPGGGRLGSGGRGGNYVAAVPTGVLPSGTGSGGPYGNGGANRSPGNETGSAGTGGNGNGVAGSASGTMGAGGAEHGALPTGSVTGFGNVSGQKPEDQGILVGGGIAAANVGSVNGSGGYGGPGNGGPGQTGGGTGSRLGGSGHGENATKGSSSNDSGGTASGNGSGSSSGQHSGSGGGPNGNGPPNNSIANASGNGVASGAPTGGASGPAPLGATPSDGQAAASGSSASGPVEFGNYNPHRLPAGAQVNDQLDFSGDSSNGRGLNRPVSDNAGETQIHSPDPEDVVERRKKTKIRGKDWAIRSRTPGSVPIRRTIHVEVRGDQLAILPEHGANDEAGAGRRIPLEGSTYVAREDISEALEKHIKAWGMAGEGLYWRPVIEVSVSTDGQDRAKDLARMLKNSGIELKAAAVAQNSEGETSSASR